MRQLREQSKHLKYSSNMDIFLIILGAICLLVGIIGCVAPVLPGVPLAYLGLLLLHWTDRVQFSWQFLVIWAVVVVIIQVLDYFIPAWGTKKFGGAVVGELIYFNRHPQTLSNTVEESHSAPQQTNFNRALRAGFGSFIGLLAGSILKLICCGMMVFYFVKELL